ncbi:hypothetical protein SAMN05660662_2370 [Blastococcus aurantiacus]|uniref:Uncharacterized protein n=1 Tax=Blastococcus aurantiacus TaxID=1550231 RepID=A0A1G7LKA8_9ACTN|nr:hypothetical protein [Blastococcus aurantiacus]SDF49871.1 hypothetical protein SAMN05660662_2370 [Blastococcus aurantiacus]
MDDASRTELPLLPVACTLGVTDGAAQLQRWRQLGERSLTHRVRQDQELLLVYRSDDATRAELEYLVEVERTCCAFLDWQIEEDDGLRLHIRGSAAELDTLDLR